MRAGVVGILFVVVVLGAIITYMVLKGMSASTSGGYTLPVINTQGKSKPYLFDVVATPDNVVSALEGCDIDDNYKCRDGSGCPYQVYGDKNSTVLLEGNWRWQLSADGTKCLPPPDGALNYDKSERMEKAYHLTKPLF